MPLVSVIVPNYNHARFLPRRLESILAQTYVDFELLILDDASTDNSAEIISRFVSAPHVRFIPNATNSGSPFVQWNRGIKLAQGEFVWIAESDDFAAPTFLATMVDILRSNPQVGLAYCQSWQIDSDDAIIGDLSSATAEFGSERWTRPFTNSGRDECQNLLLWKNFIPNASATLLRRSVYLRAGGAPEHMRLAGDWLMWARMLTISDLAFTPERLNYFRIHRATVRESTGWRRFFDERWEVQRYLLEAGLLTKLDQRRLTTAMTDEWFTRVVCSNRSMVATEMRAATTALWPLAKRAPVTMARVVLRRLLQPVTKWVRQRAASTR
jgi:glycosyltransferase involved in cell wall biosynthesis